MSSGGAGTPRIGAENLRRLIESAGVGVIEFDAGGRATFVNSHWRRLTGCEEALPIDADVLLGLLHHDDRETATKQWLASMDDGQAYESLIRFLHPDQTTRAVMAHMEPVTGDDGALIGVAGSIIDLTSTLETEARDRSEHYEALHRQAPVGQLVASLEGEVIEANEAFASICGTSQSELVGKFPWDLYHPDDLERVMAQYTRLASGSATLAGDEVRILRPDGTVTWINGAASLVKDASGRPRLIQTVVLDVTEQHATRQSLRESEERYRTLVDTLTEGIVILDERGRIEAVNAGAARVVGTDTSELTDSMSFPAEWQMLSAEGEPVPIEESPPGVTILTGEPVDGALVGIDRPGRKRAWLRMSTRPLRRGPDARAVMISFEDITQQKQAQDRLEQSERQYRALVETAPVGQVVTDLTGRFVQVNKAFADVLGYEPAEMVGMMPWDTIHPGDLHMVGARLQEVLDGEVESFEIERRAIRSDGTIVWCGGPISLVRGADGEPHQIHAMVQDVTRRHEAEEALQQSEERYRTTVDSLHEGVLAFRRDGTFFMNARAEELTGISQDELLGADFEPLVAADIDGVEIPQDQQPLLIAARSGEPVVDQLIQVDRGEGDMRWLLCSATPLLTPAGEPDGAVSTFSDVTEKVEHDRVLAHQATHDPLTDLPNRMLLLELIDHALSVTRRRGGLVALLFLDLDRFKTVNDTLGHEAGDLLLRQVAERISGVLRPSDTITRVGGDEFVVLCDLVHDEHEAVAITQRIALALESEVFEIAGGELQVSASIGISLSRDHDSHAESLLRDADSAMYRAKDLGRARHELFDENMRRRSAERLGLAEELALAIERDEIVVHYQPLVELRTGRVTGVEALARWEHPEHGLLMPADFIGLAEETGLIVGLGLSVLSQACGQAAQWERQLGTQPIMHVNLSAKQLGRTNLARLVKGVLDQSEADPTLLCLEITESVLMEDAEASSTALAELKATGVALAIDDFGTGYSSLAYLRRFPVDVVKVDRTFVDGLGPDPDDFAIVSAIVNLSRTLEMSCIAEGVETPEQLAELRTLGCDSAQGFLFAKPAAADHILPYLTQGFALD